jgi:hypothetical protein
VVDVLAGRPSIPARATVMNLSSSPMRRRWDMSYPVALQAISRLGAEHLAHRRRERLANRPSRSAPAMPVIARAISSGGSGSRKFTARQASSEGPPLKFHADRDQPLDTPLTEASAFR